MQLKSNDLSSNLKNNNEINVKETIFIESKNTWNKKGVRHSFYNIEIQVSNRRKEIQISTIKVFLLDHKIYEN